MDTEALRVSLFSLKLSCPGVAKQEIYDFRFVEVMRIAYVIKRDWGNIVEINTALVQNHPWIHG